MTRLTDSDIAALPPSERRKQTIRRNNQDRADGSRSALEARQQRITQGLVQDLRSLGTKREPPALRREEPKGGIPSSRGYVERNLQPGSGGGGSGAPLLTEVPGSREYHETSDRFYSNSYLIFVEIKPLKAIEFVTPDGQKVRHEFELPPEPSYAG